MSPAPLVGDSTTSISVELTDAKKFAVEWLSQNEGWLSEFHLRIHGYAEPPFREFKSAAAYVELLRQQGFTVEEASGDMPTAFVATWGNDGPVLAAHAEYDAVAGISQQAVPYKAPREGLHPSAPGHNCTHSMLGVGSLSGILAAKAAMERFGIRGTLKFFGEPAEKQMSSKAVHAVRGYYDGLDAMLSYHPLAENTTIWDTHCGSYWSAVFTFECLDPENYLPGTQAKAAIDGGMQVWHAWARTPGAIDALGLMYTTTKYTKEAMFPHTGSWSMNEWIMAAGEGTSDNHAPHYSMIQYAWRAPNLEMQERMFKVLEKNATAAADATGCKVYLTWVTKVRPGLKNHTLSELAYRNMEILEPPQYSDTAVEFLQEMQRNLGLEPDENPIMDHCMGLTHPEDFEAATREMLPSWQMNYTSDDYTENTWHTPTLRFYTARVGFPGSVKPPYPGYNYPDWTNVATGGVPALVDPGMFFAGRIVASTVLDLCTTPALLQRARAEFEERTGGGIGGSEWLAPLLPEGFRAPSDLPWPDYTTDALGGLQWNSQPVNPPARVELA